MVGKASPNNTGTHPDGLLAVLGAVKQLTLSPQEEEDGSKLVRRHERLDDHSLRV
jgi:hypothetical protein